MELLKKLYSINSPSGEEEIMKNFVREYAEQIDGLELTEDEYGNLFAVKGQSETYPCLVCHLDEVHFPQEKKIVEEEGKIYGIGKEGERAGIGADDKNGIWILLNALKKHPVLKAAFFVGEENGCVGSSECDLGFFSDCRFLIEPDRRGKSDLITAASGTSITSGRFVDDCRYADFGYQPARGYRTDVLMLTERGLGISTLNLSCGYYEPHHPEEYTVIDDLLNCRKFIDFMIENLTDVYRI